MFLAEPLTGLTFLANAGTALMHWSLLYLLLGNLVIGFVEGLIVARLLRACRTAPAVAMMIVANYVSAFAGFFALGAGQGELVELTTAGLLLPHLRGLGWMFLLTLAIETPVVFFLVRGPRPGRRAIRASLLAQLSTYALLIAFFVSISSYGWVQHTTWEAEPHFVQAPRAQVYYREGRGGPWWRVELGRPDRPVRVDEAADPRVEAAEAAEEEYEHVYPDSTRDLRPEPRGPWSVRAGFWSVEGLLAENEETGSRYRFNLETPMMGAWVRYVTVLPGDQVVLAIGRQIYVLDLPTRRLAWIAKGHATYVVLPAAEGP